MEKRVTEADKVVELDVGGECSGFKVSRSLLTSVPGSALEALFSGRHPVEKIDNRVFIDRNPVIFREVINYLRNDFKLSKRVLNDEYLFDEVITDLEYWGLIDKSQPQNMPIFEDKAALMQK